LEIKGNQATIDHEWRAVLYRKVKKQGKRDWISQAAGPFTLLETDFVKSMSNDSQSQLNKWETYLLWLLRLVSTVILLSIFPIFFPRSWMETTHQAMGLGIVPDRPIFWYLARSLSLLYFAHGVLVFGLSTDIRRFWPLIKLLGWLNIFLGTILLGIDLEAPMPLWWTLAEGPGIIGGGILILVLTRQSEKLSST
jgi:hypothetical protein